MFTFHFRQSRAARYATPPALSAALLGGLLAFLFFNWSPAKVFMGDGASGFLGFSFAALTLLVAEPTPADLWLKLNLGALALFPFLFDGTFTLIRRAYIILKADDHPSRSGDASHNTLPDRKRQNRSAGAGTSPIRNFISAIRNLARLAELGNAHGSHLYQRWTQVGLSVTA